jgi:hypothetical protein
MPDSILHQHYTLTTLQLLHASMAILHARAGSCLRRRRRAAAAAQVLIASKGMKMDPFQSLYYVSPACLLCLVVPFLAVELPGVRALAADPSWAFRPAVFLANAATALALNLAVFLLIGKTSALTMNIAGVIKDWSLIYSSYSVFRAPVTRLNLAGTPPPSCVCTHRLRLCSNSSRLLRWRVVQCSLRAYIWPRGTLLAHV